MLPEKFINVINAFGNVSWLFIRMWKWLECLCFVSYCSTSNWPWTITTTIDLRWSVKPREVFLKRSPLKVESFIRFLQPKLYPYIIVALQIQHVMEIHWRISYFTAIAVQTMLWKSRGRFKTRKEEVMSLKNRPLNTWIAVSGSDFLAYFETVIKYRLHLTASFSDIQFLWKVVLKGLWAHFRAYPLLSASDFSKKNESWCRSRALLDLYRTFHWLRVSTLMRSFRAVTR